MYDDAPIELFRLILTKAPAREFTVIAAATGEDLEGGGKCIEPDKETASQSRSDTAELPLIQASERDMYVSISCLRLS
jgi:hypothetical protein